MGFQHNIKTEHLHAFQDARCFEKLRLDRHGLIGFEKVSGKLQALTGFSHCLRGGVTLLSSEQATELFRYSTSDPLSRGFCAQLAVEEGSGSGFCEAGAQETKETGNTSLGRICRRSGFADRAPELGGAAQACF